MSDVPVAPARTWRAAAFAALAVALLFALRARSDGAAPDAVVILASFVLVMLLVRPLTARERNLPIVFACLLAAEFALHVAFLFASTGQLAHPGGTGLVCSPAAPERIGSCSPTQQGGVTLLVVQLAAALLFAWWARRADCALCTVAREIVVRPVRLVRRLARVLVSAFAVLVAFAPLDEVRCARPHEASILPRQPRRAHAVGRRGPPRRRRSGLSSTPAAAARLVFSS